MRQISINPFANEYNNIKYICSNDGSDYYFWINDNEYGNVPGQIIQVNKKYEYYVYYLDEKCDEYVSTVQEKCKRLFLLK